MIPLVLCEVGVLLVFALEEVGQDVFVPPALVAQVSPVIEVPSVASHVNHGVEDTGAS